MARSLYVKQKNLIWCATGTQSTYPSNFTPYGVLFTTLPSAADTGGVEPLTANGYARVNLTGKFGSPPVPNSNAELISVADIVWPTATAPWLSIVGWGIVSTSSGAYNLLRAVPLTEIKSMGTGDVFTLPAGTAVLREP